MLAISHVTLTYPGGVQALNDVSLDLRPGLFGLLGPNGAGKSSLMRVLATLQTPDSGRITFDGHDIVAEPMTLRRTLGYLPQEFGAYPGVSARALLTHLAVLKGITASPARREHVDALLHKVNLWEHRDRPVHSFSGGMRQRFGIAQALIGEPRLIIVDEPTAGLDPEERNRFLNLLSEIGEHVVVILSTHLVEDVRQLCPAMAIIRRGQVVLTGAPAALVREMEGRVWQRHVARGERVSTDADHLVLSTQLAGGVRSIRVLAHAPPSHEYVPVAPILEDVYFAALAGEVVR